MINVSSGNDLIAELPEWKSSVVERMSQPTVFINGRIGMLWTRYDFHVDNKLSHCGTELFTFMKSEHDWVITGVSWSVEKENCHIK